MVTSQVHRAPSAEDRADMQEFWRFYAARRAKISAHAIAAAERSPEWRAVLARLSAEDRAVQDEVSFALQRDAILEGRWDPYLASLHEQGEQYARAGVSYGAWFELIRAYRDGVRDELQVLLREHPERNLPIVHAASQGLNHLIDLAVERIGAAYLSAKERLVAVSEDRYRTMFEQSPLPMWMFDRATLRFVTVNDAAVRHYGYSRDEFAAMTIADIRPPEDLAALHEDVRHANGASALATWRHRKKDGTIIAVEIRANDLKLGDLDVRLVLLNDVTDRDRAQEALKKTEEQLRHAQKMEAVGRLAGSVAHDFNNVLTVVQSYSSILEDSLGPTDPRHDDAAEIRRAAERAAGFTRQLLMMSRHSVAAPRSLDLHEVVHGFAPMLRRLLGERIALTVHRWSLPKVIADPGQVEQVLMNLAVNARDAMPDGGKLTIEARVVEIDETVATARAMRPGRHVEIAVTDTGTGMNLETQRRIFEPFFTTKEAGKGTGLGLSIVHGIVVQGGGGISVYSEPGHGTTFRVSFPITDQTIAPREAVNAIAPRTLPPMHVLVVDDQPDLRAVAARILRDAGCTVIEAATAGEARRLCVSHERAIDLVLLDVVLPDERGDVLVHQLRALRRGVTIIQMSGYPAGALTAGGATPENLLTKPFSPSELRAAVAGACGIASDAVTAIAPPPARSRRRVLVADDDAGLRRAWAKLLGFADFEVVEADSGYKAITALESAPFDVVISDVQMPDGGGLDLLRAVRRIDLDVPVILVTGDPSVAAAAEAVEYGAFRYLTKPIDGKTLTSTIDHATRAHALARLRREASLVTGAHVGVADRAGLEVRFEQAIDGLWMAFQPIVHASTGVLFGVEALMRSREPSIASPLALLDAATQLDRLPMIGRKVRALSSAAIAQRTDSVALFVNLHPLDLEDIDLIDESAPLSRIAPRVILEVTERASLDSSPRLTERIARLRELGFRLAVDDIGAGYSGLTSFTELTPEVVKIDMSLVRDVHKSALKQRTIGALCRLCQEVGTLVVGEGVETIEERDALVALGCDLLQGYLIGKPTRA